jgi:hypothetical protein
MSFHRRLAPWTAALALAGTACLQAAPPKPDPLVSCLGRGKRSPVYNDEHAALGALVDLNGDGVPDETFYLENGVPSRAEIDDDFDGNIDLWLTFEHQRVSEWRDKGGRSGRLGEGRPPAELARLMPDLDPAALPGCMERPEVKDYLDDVKKRIEAHWTAAKSDAQSRTRLNFTLDAKGQVIGACVRESDAPGGGESVLHALYAADPLPPMPEPARCLARHHLIGTFASEPSS